MNGLDLDLRLGRDDASRLGITARMLDDTLYDAFGQRQVAVTYGVMNQYRVVLEMMPELVTGPESVNRLYVRSPTGGTLVPIEHMVTPKIAPTPLTINHQGQFPSTTISFNLTEGASLGDAVDAVRAAEREIGLPATTRAEFRGTAQEFQSSLKSEPWLILAALVTIYIVLGMLYESLVHPITIISTLPSAGVGALISLAAFKFDLTIIALIGILLLLGIVKKNAIMMVDFAIDAERSEGLSPAAAIEKACLLRFRPIIMTTLAALLAAVALVVSRGVGSELRQPLGVAIVGGLLVSQVLTLFTTPVVYLALERFSRNTHQRAAPASHAPATM
jgi:multidrug efflux pump subunit AcrB